MPINTIAVSVETTGSGCSLCEDQARRWSDTSLWVSLLDTTLAEASERRRVLAIRSGDDFVLTIPPGQAVPPRHEAVLLSRWVFETLATIATPAVFAVWESKEATKPIAVGGVDDLPIRVDDPPAR